MLVLLPSPKINFKKEYGECLVYLSQSNMAKSIIDDLDDADECIGVTIVKNAGGSKYDPPYHSGCPNAYTGGLITWDVGQDVRTIDYAPNDSFVGEDKSEARPNAPWTKESGWKERLVEKLFGARTRTGRLTLAVCLIHEMGHAVQYLSDPTGFQHLEGSDLMELEKLNIQAVEVTVVQELRALGYNEGIRWSYGGQGRYNGTNHWNNWLSKILGV